MIETLQTRLYELEQFANALVSSQLTHLSWVSIGVIFAVPLVLFVSQLNKGLTAHKTATQLRGVL